jgi:hypothetical protein
MENLKLLYKRLLELTNSNSNSFFEQRVSVFSYAKGVDYEKNNNIILFVGRSVNGWNDFDKNELVKNQDKILGEIGLDDLQWTIDQWGSQNEYNTKKSAFWRLNKKISDSLFGENLENLNKVSWTNLYKVSKAKAGNPSERLCDFQIDLAKQILIEEVNLLKPKYIVFHTSFNWVRPFLSDNENIKVELLNDKGYVEAIGSFYNSKFIVGQHPQGKSETEQLREIIQYLK